ncbi:MULTISPECIES: hypothetical protein [Actinomycetes]|uniref:Uncharacterized protein n=2 Tax=Actinomycetes TaxID=1760 RepID=A0ABP6LVZ1_9MICC|nr:hypothetical protein [Nesterenkonia sp. PF2B19]OSM42866.1 hypothetical protein BCY76_011790 [Nesterenkonia sp. PF2B19]
MRQTRSQRRWGAVQGAIAGVAVLLLGLALVSGDVHVGSVTVERSVPVGVVVLLCGAAYGVGSALTWRRARPGRTEDLADSGRPR